MVTFLLPSLPSSLLPTLSASLQFLSITKVDYMVPIPGELTFSSNTSQCFTMAITDDNIFEGLEAFSVALSSSDPNLRLVGPGGVSAMQITAVVGIVDNDGENL